MYSCYSSIRHASSWNFGRTKDPEDENIVSQMTESDSLNVTSPVPGNLTEIAAEIADAINVIEQGSIAAATAEAFVTTAAFMNSFQYVHDSGLSW